MTDFIETLKGMVAQWEESEDLPKDTILMRMGKTFQPVNEWLSWTVHRDDEDKVICVSGAPSNGTQYRIIITRLNNLQQALMGSCEYIIDLEFGYSDVRKYHWFTSDHFEEEHPSYISEKLGIGAHDAFVVSAILCRVGEEIEKT